MKIIKVIQLNPKDNVVYVYKEGLKNKEQVKGECEQIKVSSGNNLLDL